MASGRTWAYFLSTGGTFVWSYSAWHRENVAVLRSQNRCQKKGSFENLFRQVHVLETLEILYSVLGVWTKQGESDHSPEILL